MEGRSQCSGILQVDHLSKSFVGRMHVIIHHHDPDSFIAQFVIRLQARREFVCQLRDSLFPQQGNILLES